MTQPVHAGRRYRRFLLGAVVAGVAALLVGAQLGQYFAGLVVYAVAAAAAFGVFAYVRVRDDLAIQDEWEATLERRASHLTMQLFGFAGVFGFVALYVLDAAGRASVGPTVQTLSTVFTVVWLTWGGVYLWLRYRP
jgi:uncharacterized membrane protein